MRETAQMGRAVHNLLEDEAGIGVIELVLILVVICTINLSCVLCVLWVF